MIMQAIRALAPWVESMGSIKARREGFARQKSAMQGRTQEKTQMRGWDVDDQMMSLRAQ